MLYYIKATQSKNIEADILCLTIYHSLLFPASRGLVETSVNGSVLTLNNVSLSDAGVFVCLAHNGIPRDRPVTIREKIYLLVNRK